jgi:hypothetical protein
MSIEHNILNIRIEFGILKKNHREMTAGFTTVYLFKATKHIMCKATKHMK